MVLGVGAWLGSAQHCGYSALLFTTKREHSPSAISFRLGPGCKAGQIWSNCEVFSSPALPQELGEALAVSPLRQLRPFQGCIHLTARGTSTGYSLSVFSNHSHGFALFTLIVLLIIGVILCLQLAQRSPGLAVSDRVPERECRPPPHSSSCIDCPSAWAHSGNGGCFLFYRSMCYFPCNPPRLLRRKLWVAKLWVFSKAESHMIWPICPWVWF